MASLTARDDLVQLYPIDIGSNLHPKRQVICSGSKEKPVSTMETLFIRALPPGLNVAANEVGMRQLVNGRLRACL